MHLPEAADPAALAGQLGDSAIPDLAADTARRVPDRLAVAVDGQRITHGALDAGARQVAAWLAARTEPGDRVLLAAAASPGFLQCYLGALRAGAVVVLANPGYTTAELGQLAADSAAVLAFADPEPARQLAALPSPPLIVPAADPPAADSPAGGLPRGPLSPRATAVLAYTSGTTGRPKGVPLAHGQLAASVRAAMAAWRWTADDVLVHALPLFHQHGLSGLHATLIAGSSAHIRSRFTAADLIEVARAESATVLFGVPTIYQALLESSPNSGAPASGAPAGRPALAFLRLAVCGSAPLSPALAARLPGLLGQLPLVRYGTTESGLDVSNPLAGRCGDTVGLPLPGVLCRVQAEGAEAAPGTEGEIQVRGPQVFGGYWHDPAATAAAFTPDGWFCTGDIGAIDPATGHLVIRGRIKELIITGGMNVHPREVEIALESHPSVAEAAVAGLPHPRWGEQVTAWVVTRPGPALAEDVLIAHARSVLAGYKCPKRVIQVAAIPRTALGKVNRAELAARFAHD